MRLALVVLLFLALAAPARAATAQVAIADSCGSDVACGKYDAGHDFPVVLFIGSPGEANHVVASRAGDEETPSAPRAVVAVGEGGRPPDPHPPTYTAAPSLEPLPPFLAPL